MKYQGVASVWIGLIVLTVSLNACIAGHEDSPDSALQEIISTRLANPELCPSGDSQDVQQVVDATPPGGMARLPEGCYRIDKTVNVLPGIHLIGAGVEKTILYRDPKGTYWDPILLINGGKDAPGGTQISGMALIGVRDTEDIGQDYGMRISNVINFRVDHSYFEGFGWAGVRVDGASTGVVDHAIFIDNYKTGIENLGYGVGIYGKDSWSEEPQPGGSKAVFVEDSTFIGNRHAVAASAGAHYVFRHNHVLHGVVACGVDAHGMGYGNKNGTRYVEIYYNVIEDPQDRWCGIGIRGGAGVIFGNTISGYKNPILLILEWGTPDMLKSKYPAFEQVQEMYIWENQSNGHPAEPQVDETGTGFIQAGRDYFLESKPGYVPYQHPHPLTGGGLYDSTPWPPNE
jgi:hypothetical protein